ncbi:MAG: stretch-activated cation channel mid1 [Thelocarpon superellum]|nr:MAG: stretch-activated cation channel mid1 [Thelocarpon superellum]
MPLLKLSPLQSRFAASFAASVVLVLLYVVLFNPQFAYATGSIEHVDHNHRRLEVDEVGMVGDEAQEVVLGSTYYQPDFHGVDRDIIGRAASDVTSLDNNAAGSLDLSGGSVQNWVFSRSTVLGPKSPATPGLPPTLWRRETDESVMGEGGDGLSGPHLISQAAVERRQQNAATVYITLNTCTQPTGGGSPPPQLQLFVSQSTSNSKPGPGGASDQQVEVPVDQGFASYTLNATGDVYIGVAAPSVGSTFTGSYNYEVAASIDAPYHSINASDPNLLFVDSDVNSALLITRNLTDATASSNPDVFGQWVNLSPPFVMFANDAKDTSIQGMTNSFCGLSKHAQISTSQNGTINATMITRGQDNKPKEQFHVGSLNRTTTYLGILAMAGNSTAAGTGVVGGGGKVWQVMNFTTKSDDNCQLIYDLPFCSDVAYAVPSNPTNQSLVANLSTYYDNYTASLMSNFTDTLAIVACEAAPLEQFSLARTCQDCSHAYKTWLCAVTIPRCADFSSPQPYLRPRNVAAHFVDGSPPPVPTTQAELDNVASAFGNQSRNPFIDTAIKPGPYNELLPCDDLCFNLVQSCPAALQFTCPLLGKGLEYSYGFRSDQGEITCNFPGAARFLSPAARATSSAGLVVACVAAAAVVVATSVL